MLNQQPPLTAQQKVEWIATLHANEYVEPDLSTEWLGAGLWIAYAVLALVWFRSVVLRGSLRPVWRATQAALAAPVAQRVVRSRENEIEFERPRTRLFPEPSAAQL